MARQVRLLVVLAMAVTVVSAAVWLWEPTDPRRMGDDDVPVWEIDREAVTGIRIRRDGEEIALRRDGDGWVLETPIEAAADTREVEFLVVSLTRLAWATPLDGADPAAFGLAPPRAVVEVSTDDGGRHVLQIGDETPVGGSTYALVGGGVAVLPHSVGDVAGVAVDALRDRAVLPFDPAEVRRVRIATDAGILDVHGQGRRWWVEGLTRADVGRVEDLVYGLRRLRFLSFADGLVPEGIAEPVASVTVETSERTWTFDVGESGPMGTHVRRGDGVEGFVYPDSLAVVRAGPLDVADRSAFAFDPDDADEAVVAVGGATIRLSRADGGWRRDDGGDPEPLVEALAAAAIIYLRGPAPEPGASRGTVTVVDGDHTVEVTIGQEVDGYAILTDRAGGAPYRVPAAEIAPILAGG